MRPLSEQGECRRTAKHGGAFIVERIVPAVPWPMFTIGVSAGILIEGQ